MQNIIEIQVKKLLVERNMSIEKLAQLINVSRGGLTNMFSNNSMKIETLFKIAKVLNVDISYFFSISSGKNSVGWVNSFGINSDTEITNELEQLKKRNSELERLVEGNKMNLFQTQLETCEFAANIWEALEKHKIFKSKIAKDDFKEIFYTWLIRMLSSDELLASFKDKRLYELFSQLLIEAEKYWKDFLKDHEKKSIKD